MSKENDDIAFFHGVVPGCIIHVPVPSAPGVQYMLSDDLESSAALFEQMRPFDYSSPNVLVVAVTPAFAYSFVNLFIISEKNSGWVTLSGGDYRILVKP